MEDSFGEFLRSRSPVCLFVGLFVGVDPKGSLCEKLQLPLKLRVKKIGHW